MIPLLPLLDSLSSVSASSLRALGQQSLQTRLYPPRPRVRNVRVKELNIPELDHPGPPATAYQVQLATLRPLV